MVQAWRCCKSKNNKEINHWKKANKTHHRRGETFTENRHIYSIDIEPTVYKRIHKHVYIQPSRVWSVIMKGTLVPCWCLNLQIVWPPGSFATLPDLQKSISDPTGFWDFYISLTHWYKIKLSSIQAWNFDYISNNCLCLYFIILFHLTSIFIFSYYGHLQ